MQLHLTTEECELLKQLMDHEMLFLCGAVPVLRQFLAKPLLQDQLKIGGDLLGRGLSRNLQLDFEELEDLAHSLDCRKKELMKGIKSVSDEARASMERQLFTLEHLLEKVTEACVMI